MRWAWVGPYPTAFEECLAQTTLEQEKITATHMAFSAHGKATVEI